MPPLDPKCEFEVDAGNGWWQLQSPRADAYPKQLRIVRQYRRSSGLLSPSKRFEFVVVLPSAHEVSMDNRQAGYRGPLA